MPELVEKGIRVIDLGADYRLPKPMMADVSRELNEAHLHGDNLLFEGAQGTLLDVDHGTYPYVTSSNCVASSSFPLTRSHAASFMRSFAGSALASTGLRVGSRRDIEAPSPVRGAASLVRCTGILQDGIER